MIHLFALALAAAPPLGVAQMQACSGHPYNGMLFDGGFPMRANFPRFTVVNRTSEDAIVRLQDLASPRSVTVFVERRNSATVQFIPPGQYEERVAYGGKMSADCVTLRAASSIVRMAETETFEVTEKQTQTSQGVLIETGWTVSTLELYEKIVRRGRRGREKTIDLRAFNAQ